MPRLCQIVTLITTVLTTPSIGATSAGKPITFHPVTALEDLPGIEWLIEDILPAQSIAVLFGEPGAAKSFLAIDLALHVASGQRWAEKRTTRGPVVYVVAEGSRGMKDRIKAWRLTHPDADVSDAMVVLEPIMLHDLAARKRFISGIASSLPVPPSLIILDTLAQNFVGGDENSAQDMGVWLHGARLLQEQFGATILIVHHAARGAGRERGSTALRGAADAMIQMRRPSEKVNGYKMSCAKMKEGEAFEDVLFQLVPVEGTKSAVLMMAASEGGEIGIKPTLPPNLEDAALSARLAELARTTSLRAGAALLVKEFPAAWADAVNPEVAAKGRLSRARKVHGVAPDGGEMPSMLSGFEGLADGPIH